MQSLYTFPLLFFMPSFIVSLHYSEQYTDLEGQWALRPVETELYMHANCQNFFLIFPLFEFTVNVSFHSHLHFHVHFEKVWKGFEKVLYYTLIFQLPDSR